MQANNDNDDDDDDRRPIMMMMIAGRRDDAPPEVGGAASGLGRQPCQGFKDEIIICLDILLWMVITYTQRCLSVLILPPWRWRRARMSLSSFTLLGTYHSSQHHLHQLLGTIHHHPSEIIKYAKCIIAMHHHFPDNLKNAKICRLV